MNKLLGYLLFCISVLYVSMPSHASIMSNSNRWQADSDGKVRIQICIVDGSSAEQRRKGMYIGWIHDQNPSLNDVMWRIRNAVAGAWGRYSTVEFYDWRMCSALNINEQGNAVGLYIHPDASNNSHMGPDNTRGRVTSGNFSTQIKPWGNDSWCIWPGGDLNMHYSYDCAEQYAIHEFGHILGFEHEMRSPAAPAQCHNASNPSIADSGSYGNFFHSNYNYLLVNSNYDWDSIMAYDDGCADRSDGVRFGGWNLSPTDALGLLSAYGAPPSGTGVAIYDDSNYSGFTQWLNMGFFDWGTIHNDTVSSVKVAPGMRVTLFSDTHSGGNRKVLTQDTAYVGDDFNDATSSIYVGFNSAQQLDQYSESSFWFCYTRNNASLVGQVNIWWGHKASDAAWACDHWVSACPANGGCAGIFPRM